MNNVSANLTDLTGPQLVAGFNAITGGTIKRFTSRDDGVRRVAAAMDKRGKTVADVFAAAGVATPCDPVADIPAFMRREPSEDHAAYERRMAEERAKTAKARPLGATKPGEPNGGKAKKTKIRRTGNVEKAVELMKQPSGATMADLTKATGWLPHTTRAAISVQIKRKMGLAVTRTKGDDGVSVYSIPV